MKIKTKSWVLLDGQKAYYVGKRDNFHTVIYLYCGEILLTHLTQLEFDARVKPKPVEEWTKIKLTPEPSLG